MKEKKAQIILEEVKKTYDSIAGEFSNTRNRIGKEFDQFGKYINAESKILDLGCGNGRLIMYLAKILDQTSLFQNYVGIDNSKRMLDIAIKKYPRFHFKLGDQLQIPVDSNSVDVIFNIRALHHIPSNNLRLQAVNEMHRVLKQNGILIVTVWNLWQIKYVKELLRAFFLSLLTFGKYEYNDAIINWGKSKKRYYHAFTTGELKKIIKLGHFKILETPKNKHDFIIVAVK